MNWEMCSVVIGILTFLFTIFIEWPPLKARFLSLMSTPAEDSGLKHNSLNKELLNRTATPHQVRDMELAQMDRQFKVFIISVGILFVPTLILLIHDNFHQSPGGGIIGWQFLYEGIARLFTPNWSLAFYS